MISERTRSRGVLVVALLIVCVGAVAPVAAAPTDATTGVTFDDALSDESDDGGSDDGAGGDASGSNSSSDDAESEDVGNEDTDSTNDAEESNGGDSDTWEGDAGDTGTDGSAADERGGDRVGDPSDGVDETVDGAVGSAEDTLSETGETVGELTGADRSSHLSVGTYRIRTLDAATDSTDAAGGAVDSVTVDGDALLGETELLELVVALDGNGIDAPTDHAPATDTSEDTAPPLLAPGDASRGGATGDTAAGSNASLALGLGAVAAAAVTRQGALTPGLALNLGAALTAGAVPARLPGSLDRLVRTLAPFRYSRYDDSDPLEHEARADVFDVVEESPGAYLSQLAERAGVPLSTARHHVRVLEREDIVSGAKVRGKRRFYPAHATDVELAAAMSDEATAAVLDALARLGAVSVSDLADEVGRDPSTVTHHLQRLEEDDIVVRERDGRTVVNKLSPEARTALGPDAPEAEAAERGEALASD